MIEIKTSVSPRAEATQPPRLLVVTLFLSVASLFLERIRAQSVYLFILIQTVDFAILILFITELLLNFLKAARKRDFLKAEAFSSLFLLAFLVLFVYNKYLIFSGISTTNSRLPVTVVIIRNTFILLKIFGRMRRLAGFLRRITTHPARTVLISFFLTIVTGAIVLVQPFTTVDGKGLEVIDAFFTSTSAVCVTGLIVVDTATAFTFWGKLTILLLIQIGGLGIMILSFFMVFVLRQSLSMEDKFLISFMLNDNDMRDLGRNLKRIIYLTFAIEAVGALLLFSTIRSRIGFGFEALFSSIFHAVSAFCNAGFALFSNSLEDFRSDFIANLTICMLIIAGGISFSVMTESFFNIKGKIRNGISTAKQRITPLSLNTRVVLVGTAILIVAGMLFLYGVEHGNGLQDQDLKTQYLAAFFQSVTLRTAGFNTIDMSRLTSASYLFMICLMFIGAASGSTAGGIKINTIAVLFAQLRSTLQERGEVTLFQFSIKKDVVMKGFLILLFGIGAVMIGTLVLTLTEQTSFLPLLFEVVSAFGTVGLSAGITSMLTSGGKLIIMILMFSGRLGPLTLLAAATRRVTTHQIAYPQGNVVLG
jgi:trk system potassium uptake protein TrkH